MLQRLNGLIQLVFGAFFLFVNPIFSFSQVESDTVQLKEMVVASEVIVAMQKYYGVPSLKSNPIDTAILKYNQLQSIGEILKNNSSVFIKDYGPSGIQTPTFRGMNASHTKIYLNGLDISPASLGQSDLSILPSFLFNGVELNYGNSSFTEGPGAIGGGVMLQTNPGKYGATTDIGVSYGSFETMGINAAYSIRRNKWESATKYLYKKAKNDFTYRNVAQSGYPIQTQKNAETQQHGFSQAFSYSPNYYDRFSVLVLGTFTERNLPGLMTDVNVSEQNQKDGLIGAQFGWNKYWTKSNSKLIAGYTWSTLNYQDPASGINSTTINQKLQLREDFIWKLNNKWSLKSMALIDHSQAENPNYDKKEQQLQASVLIGVKGKLNKVFETGLYIQPTLNNSNSELLPMFSLAYMPLKSDEVVIGFNASQNVHFPTLNDLYWVPGGNPDLQPERSSKMELNAHWHNDINKYFHWELNGAAFYGVVDNWILWQPSDKWYWEAQNIKTVEHKGVEFSALLSKKWRTFKIQFQTNYQFVQAINKDVSDESLNKQLIYTPEHMYNYDLKTYWNNYWFGLNYVFTGIRYITTSNSAYLPEYDILNLAIGGKFSTKDRRDILWQLDVKNVFDKEYMSVAYRAMPGINFMFGVKYHFYKNP